MRRSLLLVALDATLLSIAYFSAFVLRIGWNDTLESSGLILRTLPVVVGISLLCHLRFGLFHAILRYASIDTAAAILKSVLLGVPASCLLLFLLFRLDGMPRSVFVIYGMAAILLVGGTRFLVRARLREERTKSTAPGVRLLFYGAGDSAELVLRGVSLSRDPSYVIVGLVDDDPKKHGRRIRGFRIQGGLNSVPEIAASTQVDELWVCIPNLVGEQLRKVYETGSRLGIRVKIMPQLSRDLSNGKVPTFQTPNISDLLRRPPRNLDVEGMRSWIRGRRVLITGAGGSIGSELARQVSSLGLSSLALCDSSEPSLFHIHLELSGRESPVDKPYLVDIRDDRAVERMFATAKPEIVFHAAAYKHVPFIEQSPCEGVLTNVLGLRNVAVTAAKHRTEDFVFVSTDKAVRSANVLGATKRLGEILIQILDQQHDTRFSAVRFGNVLGSSGSVVEIFRDQIRRGESLTLTDPDMTRYFMLVSEAVELVIQAGALSSGGEIFVLDMGEPVRIADMAEDLVRIMGKEPGRDLKIECIGPRPGEKTHEELLIGSVGRKTSCNDITVETAPIPEASWPALNRELDHLFEAAQAGNAGRALLYLQKLVPDFTPFFEVTQALVKASTVGDPTSRTSAALDPQRAQDEQVPVYWSKPGLS